MAEIPLACSLNQDALHKRRTELQTLRPLVRQTSQIPGGFSLEFDGSTDLLTIARLIAQERLCCPFLRFQLVAEPDMGALGLEVTGPAEAAQFLWAMFGLEPAGLELEGCSPTCASSER